MNEVKINNQVKVVLPEKFKKTKLPFLKKWTEALESGKFKKTTATLCEYSSSRQANCYCCLGVLSKVQGRLVKSEKNDGEFFDGGAKNDTSKLLSGRNPCYPVLQDEGHFPKNVSVWVGENHFESLADLNDGAKVSFATIAKIIKTIWKA